jgi:hypothetical protein
MSAAIRMSAAITLSLLNTAERLTTKLIMNCQFSIDTRFTGNRSS